MHSIREIIQYLPFFVSNDNRCIAAHLPPMVTLRPRGTAANGSAAKLVAAIRTNEALGYLDTKNMSSTALYDVLNAYFGLKYSVRNFTKYRR